MLILSVNLGDGIARVPRRINFPYKMQKFQETLNFKNASQNLQENLKISNPVHHSEKSSFRKCWIISKEQRFDTQSLCEQAFSLQYFYSDSKEHRRKWALRGWREGPGNYDHICLAIELFEKGKYIPIKEQQIGYAPPKSSRRSKVTNTMKLQYELK